MTTDITNCNVQIYFLSPAVSVNGERYEFDSLTPTSDLPQNLNMILWLSSDGSCSYYTKDMKETVLDCTQENWDKWIKPYFELWQEKYNEAHADEIYFPNRQAKALVQLNEDFDTVSTRAYVKSSLGFTANANRIAKDNVQGLIEEVGEGTVQFCDYYNQFHTLNKTQLETLKSEINQNGQALYAQKWQYRTAIEGCTDNEGLDAVVAGIKFNYMDFTQTDDETVTE